AACNDSPLTIGGATNDLGARTDGATASGAACSGLSETACNASPGCAADYCHFCGCEVAAFVRCRGADERPQPCPTPSCPVGICARTSCAVDSDCGAPNRCVLGRCYLGLGMCAASPR